MKKCDPILHLVIVGDEILADPGHEANAAHMTHVLAKSGFRVAEITVTGDTHNGIGRVLLSAAGKADVVLVTGGLGPTSDDITLAATAEAFGLSLECNDDALRGIEAKFISFGRRMSESNRKQAFIPDGGEVLPNPVGTAPGVGIEFQGTWYYFMPGVPMEMAAILDSSVIPHINERFTATDMTTSELQITGITESGLYDKVRDIAGVIETARYYPHPSGITLRFVALASSGYDAGEIADTVADRLGDLVFARGGTSLEEVVGSLLAENNLTIAVAESCTGGLIADRLTDVPGSSRYFLMGAVTYANEAKTQVIGVPESLIAEYGAVSEQVAAAMAEGIRTLSGADIGISTTGIAGPGGGTDTKPVGRMFAGLAYSGRTVTKKLQFFKERRINKRIMSQSVLDMVRLSIKGTM